MLKNFKVRTKMILLCIMVIAAMVVMCMMFSNGMNEISRISTAEMETVINSRYDSEIRKQVDTAISMLNHIYSDYQEGGITLEEAKEKGAHILRDLRYGDEGYFWADNYQGENVVLLGNDTEGTNRYEAQDVQGNYYVKDFIAHGKETEGGYTDYFFVKEGETQELPKRAYTKAFEPFEWVIGTGNYIDDIATQVQEYTDSQNAVVMEKIKEAIIFGVVLIIIVTLLVLLIARDIISSLKRAVDYNKLLGEGDFSKELPDVFLHRKDDFGTLAQTMYQMKNNISLLIGRIHQESDAIKDAADNINNEVSSVNEEMETVSATTEELAASMEEVAAASQEITAMSQEINSSAKNIMSKVGEASVRAAEIAKRAEDAMEYTINDHKAAGNISDRIRSDLGKALENVKVVEEINALSDSIMSITSQTNMLSLNASIEAARAGESGKGFAVVADQIRVLAEQSKEAVVNIQSITGQVKQAVSELSQNAKELLEFVSTDVSKSYNSFENTTQAYKDDSQYIDALITEFSDESEHLTQAIGGIIQSIEEVSRSTDEGAKGTTDIAQRITDVVLQTERMTHAAAHTNERVKELGEEVSKFVI